MTLVKFTITFTDPDGTTRTETGSVEAIGSPDAGGEHRVAHILLSELQVTVGRQAAPKHNETARRWLDVSKRPAGMHEYFDVRNSQAVWLELSNLVMGVEGDLVLAQAFKALEPPVEPPFDDETGINDLYNIHDRKMSLLNQSVHGLIKVQDLVNRLLHESLGGDLVDTNQPDWERTQLTRANVKKGLIKKHAAGLLSETHFRLINEALEIPRTIPKGGTTRSYRNKLEHHVRPSVDYPMFFSTLESRDGEDIKDASGKVIGKKHTLSARQPADYNFGDLHPAFSEYLDAIAAMLQKLSEIDILRR
jgi:hypothetical protein